MYYVLSVRKMWKASPLEAFVWFPFPLSSELDIPTFPIFIYSCLLLFPLNIIDKIMPYICLRVRYLSSFTTMHYADTVKMDLQILELKTILPKLFASLSCYLFSAFDFRFHESVHGMVESVNVKQYPGMKSLFIVILLLSSRTQTKSSTTSSVEN